VARKEKRLINLSEETQRILQHEERREAAGKIVSSDVGVVGDTFNGLFTKGREQMQPGKKRGYEGCKGKGGRRRILAEGSKLIPLRRGRRKEKTR